MDIKLRHFDEKLQQLFLYLLDMSGLVQNSIDKSIDALARRSSAKAQEVIDADKAVDEMELLIDDNCLELIALHQPMAIDVRFITTAIKINTDLERMADLAVNIAQRAQELADQPLLKPLIDIPELSRVAQGMVKQAIDAFVARDVALAKKVVLDDGKVDMLKNAIQHELIYDYMVKDGSTAPRAVALLLIARYLERICDHATNIAEDVIYLVQAKVVKHHPEMLQNRD